jgi:LacI family transcriptional regulator
MPKFLKTIPRVLVALPVVQKDCRDLFQGILNYAHFNGPWDIQRVEDFPYIAKLGAFRTWVPDGIIQDPEKKLPDRMARASKIPTVLLDADEALFSRTPSVNHDSRQIGEAVAESFLRQSLRHFAYVGSSPTSFWSRQRATAFADRLAQEGAACHLYELPSKKMATDWGVEQKHMRAWLLSLPKPCGLMAAMDLRAKQVLDTCLLTGIRVPEELSVIGVDDDEALCETTTPTLSSVLTDCERGGYLAAEMLDRLMRGLQRKPEHLTYGVKRIVHRQSSQYARAPSVLAASAVEFIRVNACAGIAVPDVAKALHVSRSVLEKDFRRAQGHPVLEEIQNRRLERLCMLLRETSLPIGEIGERCGYSTETYLKRLFRKRFATTMREYRKQPRTLRECAPALPSPRDTPASRVPSKAVCAPATKEAQVMRRGLYKIKAQVDHGILKACRRCPLSSSEIATALGHKTLSGNLRKAIPRLKAAGLLEYTLPSHPRSRLQRHRLTAEGRQALAETN